MKPHVQARFSDDHERNGQMVNYMLSNSPHSSNKLINFSDVMQFADFCTTCCDDHDHDPVSATGVLGENLGKIPVLEDAYNRNKRKRPRSRKTREQVESQRMTHIAVERNRRKQMSEHLHILRSLMPSSYVQRGDQASIIGGAIEFVRELELLVQCLESQKRRRLYGDIDHRYPTDLKPNDQTKLVGYESQTAEIKSCLADVEVKLLGVDGLIKILSRKRRAGQLIKTIAALEDLQLNIIHTNVTTIEKTHVLYSFNVKMNGEALRFTAEDIANTTQQTLSNFINATSSSLSFNNVLEY